MAQLLEGDQYSSAIVKQVTEHLEEELKAFQRETKFKNEPWVHNDEGLFPLACYKPDLFEAMKIYSADKKTHVNRFDLLMMRSNSKEITLTAWVKNDDEASSIIEDEFFTMFVIPHMLTTVGIPIK